MRRLRGVAEALDFFARQGRSPDARLPEALRESIRSNFGEDLTAADVAARIIADVRRDGDAAVRSHSSQIDGVELSFLEVPSIELDRALQTQPSEVANALRAAAGRIEAFQRKAMPRGWYDEEAQYGEVVTPIERVGIYVPGGSAPLVSTVLMTAIPARVAGVSEIVMCTPAPGDELPDGAILAAAKIAGVGRVFKLGGAQAIAAMAVGTETVPKVDLVCGPGAIFTTAAKRLLYGEVGIDGIFGPTETLVIGDATADPEFCAADLIAQAEHDPMARPVFLTTDAGTADRVEAAVSAQVDGIERKAIACAALEANGAVIVVDSAGDAMQVANAMAPEHLCLAVSDPGSYLPHVRAAGGVFVGEYSAEVLGDYIAGPSHVMPTAGTARFASALSVRSFLRITPVVKMGSEAFLKVGREASLLAGLEGLGGHAAAADVRLKKLVGE